MRRKHTSGGVGDWKRARMGGSAGVNCEIVEVSEWGHGCVWGDVNVGIET